jgi:hypothetical protein
VLEHGELRQVVKRWAESVRGVNHYSQDAALLAWLSESSRDVTGAHNTRALSVAERSIASAKLFPCDKQESEEFPTVNGRSAGGLSLIKLEL